MHLHHFLSGDNSRHNRTGACNLNMLPGNETSCSTSVNKKHCYEKQLLPVDSGGSLIE